jgi:Icc protein
MERRSVLKSLGGLLLLPSIGIAATSASKKPVLRIAHITDVHLKNELGAPVKFTKCLRHVQEQVPRLTSF